VPTRSLSLGRLTQGALESLRAQIVAGELAPGQRLLEPELTQRLAISRTPIREALRVLHSERLLVLRPGGGYVVAPVNAEDAHEIYAVRGSLEGMLAGEAAAKWTLSYRGDISSVLDRAERLLDFEEDLKVLGKQFHRIIRRISGNQLADNLLRDLEPHSDRLRHYTQHVTENRHIALRQHTAIAEAMFARDVSATEQAMREHMVSGWERLKIEIERYEADEASPFDTKRVPDPAAG
jgi:DNA-binding GntR family transcriptional regulator